MRIRPRALAVLCLTTVPCGLTLPADRSRIQQAESAFDRVQASPAPDANEAASCVAAQDALLPKTKPGDRWLVHYRRGFCALILAARRNDRSGYGTAVQEFSETAESLPSVLKKQIPQGLTALQAISTALAADPDKVPVGDLKSVSDSARCFDSALMSARMCMLLSDAAAVWIGWSAYRKDDLNAAAAALEKVPASPWTAWVSGSLAWHQHRWPEAAALYTRAIAGWSSPSGLVELFAPKPDIATAWYQLGATQYQAGDYGSAIASFDAAVRESHGGSWYIFVRARAKEMLGLREAALADYELASRDKQTSFYSAMRWLRQAEFTRANAGFTAALAALPPDIPRADVEGWRTVAVLGEGRCADPPDLANASVFFPKDEVEASVLECRLAAASTLGQLLALEEQLGDGAAALKKSSFAARMAQAYVKQGVAAEDRKDTYSAALSYRRALEWNPGDAKARFNLGAIYIGDRKYDLAEAQYRALVNADVRDAEARYWLAATILAQHPAAARRSEACRLLRETLPAVDANRRKQFASALSAAGCPL